MSGELEQIVSVRVLTTPEAGEPVGALLESIFGTTASVWSEDGSSEAKVTVYLERESVGPAEEASLGQGLDVLRATGLDVGEGEWAVERVKREDWSESWKKHFSPIEVSDRLLVKPEWEEIEPKLGQAQYLTAGVVKLHPVAAASLVIQGTTPIGGEQLVDPQRMCRGRRLGLGVAGDHPGQQQEKCHSVEHEPDLRPCNFAESPHSIKTNPPIDHTNMPRKTERTILFSLQTNYPTSFYGCLHIDWPAAVLAVGHQVKFSVRPVQYDEGV